MPIRLEITGGTPAELCREVADLAWRLGVIPVTGAQTGRVVIEPHAEKSVDHPATTPSEIQDKPRQKGPVPDEKPTVPPQEPQGAVWDTATEALTQTPPAAPEAPQPASQTPPALTELARKASEVSKIVGTAGIKAVMAPYGPLSKWPPEEWGRLDAQLTAALAGGQS